MSTRRQLEQIQKNKMRGSRARSAGTMVKRLAKQLFEHDFAASSGVALFLAGVVDDDFRTHGRVGQVRGGTLTINVDHPALVYSMRAQWLLPLARALRERAGQPRISRVVFEFGEAGVSIPAPQGNQEELGHGDW